MLPWDVSISLVPEVRTQISLRQMQSMGALLRADQYGVWMLPQRLLTVSYPPGPPGLHVTPVRRKGTDTLTCSGPLSSMGSCATSLTRKLKTVLPTDPAEVKCDVKALCVHRQGGV